MKLIYTPIYLSLFSIVLVSCSEEKKEKPVEKNTALIIGDPLDCGLDSLTLFPVGASYNPVVVEPEERADEGVVEDQMAFEEAQYSLRSSDVSFTTNQAAGNTYMWDSKAQVEYTNEKQEDLDIRNLLFYNLLTGESYPLVEDSIHILSFALHKEFERPLIFFRIVKEDYNKDGRYDGSDPVMLNVSNLDGTDFTQITPQTEHFIDYNLYTQTNSILIKTAIDSNKDLTFLTDDETNFRSMSLSNPKLAENIFDDKMKDKLRVFNQ